jgi:hypothetical protein
MPRYTRHLTAYQRGRAPWSLSPKKSKACIGDPYTGKDVK